MTDVSTLLDDLEGHGVVEVEGGFSIDKEKARAKMRQFQLADPRRYVLLLVQAAVQQGASRIEFEIDADDMRVYFDGPGYSRDDLDDLFVSLFGDRSDDGLRSRQELALGLNAALALDPKFVRVETEHASGCARLDLRPEDPDIPPAVEIDAVDGGRSGTAIHVKERMRAGVVLRFFRNVRGRIAEEQILLEAAAHARVPIILDGGRISHGISIKWAFRRVQIASETAHGEAGFVDPVPEGPSVILDESIIAPRVHLLNAGVLLCTRELPGFPVGFVAMVDAPGLRKDVSQSDVVLDEAYAALQEELMQAADRCLLQIARDLEAADPDASPLPGWFRTRLPEITARRLLSLPTSRHAAGVDRALRAMKVWPLLDGTLVSLRELGRRPKIDFLSRESEDGIVAADHARNLLAKTPLRRSLLRKLFGKKLRDRTAALETATKRQRAFEAFSLRLHPATLGSGIYRQRRAFDLPGGRGEVALRDVVGEGPKLLLVLEGKLLEEIDLAEACPLPGLLAVVEAPLRAAANWDRSCRDQALAGALHAVAATMHELLNDEAHRIGHAKLTPSEVQLFLNFLEMRQGKGVEHAVYLGAGFSKRTAKRWLKKLGKSAKGHLVNSPDHPLAALRLFQTVDGREVSLRALDEQRGSDGVVRVVSSEREGMSAPPFTIVRVREQQLALLRSVFSHSSVVLFGREYQHLLSERAWMERPAEKLRSRDGGIRFFSDFTWNGCEGAVGVSTRAAEEARRGLTAQIWIYKHRRLLQSVTRPWVVPGLSIRLNWDEVPVNSEWTEVLDEGLDALGEPTCLATMAVLADGLRATMARDDRQHVMPWMMFAPFAFGSWVLAFDRSWEADAEAAASALDALTAAVDHDAESVDEPGGVSMLDAIGRSSSSVSGDPVSARRRFFASVAGHWGVLRSMPLFPALGRVVSLAEVLESITLHGHVLWVEGGDAEVASSPPRVVLRASASLTVLRERLGDKHFAYGRSWMEAWTASEAFETAAPLEAIALDPKHMLVVVGVEDENMRGEVGLPAEVPGGAGLVTACRRSRKVADVVLESSLPFAGILECESFGEGRGFTSVGEYDTVRIAQLCLRALPELCAALAKAWHGLPDERRRFARAWAVRILADESVDARASASLRALPLLDTPFQDAVSVADLQAAVESGTRVGTLIPTEQPLRIEDGEHDVMAVRVRTSYERALVERWVRGVVDYNDYAAMIQAKAERLAQARDMPQAPADAVAVLPVKGAGVHGCLWLAPPPAQPVVSVGTEAKVLTEAWLHPAFATGGAVWGPAVRVGESTEPVTLNKDARAMLVARAVELYRSVLRRFAGARRSAEPEDERLEVERTVLRELVERMLENNLDERENGNRRMRKLYRALKEEPLFPTSSGRFLSLEDIRRTRPPRYVALWMRWSPPAVDAPPEPEPKPEPATQPEAAPETGAAPAPEVEAAPQAEPETQDVSAPEAEPAPQPAAPPPPPTPVERLLEAVRAELRCMRRGNARVVSDGLLDQLTFGPLAAPRLAECTDAGVVLCLTHAATRRALDAMEDPAWVSLLASSAYTAINYHLEEVTDADEVLFHRLHAEHLAT